MSRRYLGNSVPTDSDDATERDVIMGRGKRVSEWPGNVHFRQVVSKHRNAYIDAHRADKVKVAIKVLNEIQRKGGRFMTEEPDGSWVEIERQRAVEKCCQALREKDKANPPTGNPFKGKPQKPPTTTKRKVSPATSGGPKRKVTKPSKNVESDDESDGGGGDGGTRSESETESDSESKSGSSSSESESESDGEEKKKKDGDATPKLMDSPVNQVWHTQEGEMFKKLEGFARVHGHCAVPPVFPSDPLLADWCTAQRQIHRSIRLGFRDETPTQRNIIKQLTELKFVWDYEEWHWERQFNRLVASYEDATKNGKDTVDQVCVNWLQDQRRQQLEDRSNILSSRVGKLKDAGITLT